LRSHFLQGGPFRCNVQAALTAATKMMFDRDPNCIEQAFQFVLSMRLA